MPSRRKNKNPGQASGLTGVFFGKLPGEKDVNAILKPETDTAGIMRKVIPPPSHYLCVNLGAGIPPSDACAFFYIQHDAELFHTEFSKRKK